jgi:hypothetical protein
MRRAKKGQGFGERFDNYSNVRYTCMYSTTPGSGNAPLVPRTLFRAAWLDILGGQRVVDGPHLCLSQGSGPVGDEPNARAQPPTPPVIS